MLPELISTAHHMTTRLLLLQLLLLLAASLSACNERSPASSADDDGAADTPRPNEQDAAVRKDVHTNAAGCPAERPVPWAWTVRPDACPDLPDGTECHYPAPGCAAGVAADHVCVCKGGTLECTPIWQGNCLPVSSDFDTWWMNPDVRPAPDHRELAQACAPMPRSDADPCIASGPTEDSTCSVDADCSTDERCMPTHTFGSSWNCQCQANGCTSDSDCADSDVCTCGTFDALPQGCDGWSAPCMNDCTPAECRTDADCGETKFCSPVYDPCRWSIVRYACHDPGKAECLSDHECTPVGGTRFCNQVGDTWACVQPSVCE